jgi:hypothetical protein
LTKRATFSTFLDDFWQILKQQNKQITSLETKRKKTENKTWEIKTTFAGGDRISSSIKLLILQSLNLLSSLLYKKLERVLFPVPLRP